MAKAAVVETNEEGTAMQRAIAGPANFLQFIKETRQEMSKVHAPSRAEVQSTTVVVIIAVFMFAAYFELVDLVLGRGIDQMFVHLMKH
jgi:preprotein translocase subunit SecE